MIVRLEGVVLKVKSKQELEKCSPRNTESPELVSIYDLMGKADVMERLDTFRMSGHSMAGVFVLEGGKLTSADEAYGEPPPQFSQALIDLAEKIIYTGQESFIQSEDRIYVGAPIWLTFRGSKYLKGCFVGWPPGQQLKESVKIAKFIAGTFSDRISSAFASNALDNELKVGSELLIMMEQIEAGLMVVDRDLNIVWHNSVISKRYKKDDMSGQICYRAHGLEMPCNPCPALTAFKTGKPELAIPTRDEHGIVKLRTSAMPIFNDLGEVHQVLVVTTEVSGDELAESKLTHFRLLVDASEDFMMISNASTGKVLAVNRRMLDRLGLSGKDLEKEHGLGIVSEEDSHKFHEAAAKAKKLGMAMETVSLNTSTGETIPVQAMIVYDEESDVIECIFKDITEKLKMEEEINTRSEELAAQNQRVMEMVAERDRFFRNVSHELRTPLTSIVGFTELLLEDEEEPLSDRQKHLMRRVVGNSHKLLALVNDLLEISRAESGRMEIRPGEINLDQYLPNVVGNLSSLAAAKNLHLSVSISQEIPIVCTDEQKLGQIIVNLVSNAIKFTVSGGVDVNAYVEADSFSISVTDTGLGIAEEDFENIFEEFYRVGQPGVRQHGSGLGLSIVKKLTTLLGGKIHIKSVVGKGSTFTVTFPQSLHLIPPDPEAKQLDLI